jgi:hypothetical protein
MIERGLSPPTVRYTHAVLRSALRQASRWRLLLENPVDGVTIPQQLRDEMPSLTVEQAQAFLRAALATPHGPVLAVALTTGMRPSEYLARTEMECKRKSVIYVSYCRHCMHMVRTSPLLENHCCGSGRAGGESECNDAGSGNEAA